MRNEKPNGWPHARRTADEHSRHRFNEFRRSRIRVGTADLKIAAVALLNDALLLTANRQDFEVIPGIRFANWLD